jgi:hypothetical protein
MQDEDREAKAAVWLQRLRAAASIMHARRWKSNRIPIRHAEQCTAYCETN